MDDDVQFAAETLPGPGSVTWRWFAATPGVLLTGTGLLLQVAHPVVGAGVSQHSDFRRRPWTRAWRTHLSTLRFVYGMGDGAQAEGRRLLEVHKEIKGVDSAGRRYHALDPHAYAWVHLTLARFTVDTAALFGDPLTESELDQMWCEFRAIGLALGLKEQHLAPDWATACAHFDEVVRDILEANQSTRDVLDALIAPARPSRYLPSPLWRLLTRPASRVLRLTTVGALPPVLRERMNLNWTERDQRELTRLARAVRAVDRRLPEPLRYPPLAYSLILRARLRHRWAT